jgi:DNA-binding IclR family transcriptional regulator
MAIQQEPISIAVERTLAVLEAIAERSSGMSNADVHRRLKIPKSSASYILRTLVKGGYLRRDRESGRYHLGLKVVGLSHRALAGLDVREIAQPVLRQLVDSTQLTAHLAILDNHQAVYIEKQDAPGFVKMNTWVGRRLDVHSTSVGKVLISTFDEAQIAELVAHRGLSKRTTQTIATVPRLLRDLEKVRELGYAIDDEENSPGVRCVAAPIFNSESSIEAAIGVSGTTYQFERAAIPKMADLVKAAARKISHQLGASRRS